MTAPTGELDVAVIGAGIVGLSTAVYLQRAGRRVTLIDPLPPGHGCSFGNAGLINAESHLPLAVPGMLAKVPRWLLDPLAPLSVYPAYALTAAPWLAQLVWAGRMSQVRAGAKALRALNQGAFDRYRELLGPEAFGELIRPVGGVHLLGDGREDRWEQVARQMRTEMAVESRALSPAELHDLFPGLHAPGRRAVLYPRNGHTVSPIGITTALAEQLRAGGAAFRTERVLKLIPRETGGATLLTDTANLVAREVVMAAGAWSRALLEPLGVRLPLETERGYHLELAEPSVDLPMALIDKPRGLAVTPMRDGLRLAGTVEIAGLHAPPNEARALALEGHARALFPQLTFTTKRIWMGFRPSLPDSVAAAGRAPGVPWLYVVAGHGHDGMIGGPSSARLVSELMTGRAPHLDPAPYALERFGGPVRAAA